MKTLFPIHFLHLDTQFSSPAHNCRESSQHPRALVSTLFTLSDIPALRALQRAALRRRSRCELDAAGAGWH